MREIPLLVTGLRGVFVLDGAGKLGLLDLGDSDVIIDDHAPCGVFMHERFHYRYDRGIWELQERNDFMNFHHGAFPLHHIL